MSSEAFEDPETDHQELESVIIDSAKMAGPSDPDAAAEAERLCEIRDKIDFRISQINPSRVTVMNTGMMHSKLSDIQGLTEQYALGMSKLTSKFPTLESSFKAQYNADRESLLNAVRNHEDKILEKIYNLGQTNQQSPANTLASAVPQPAAQQSHVSNDYGIAAATVAKAVVKFNNLLELALTTKQDMEEDGVYLGTAPDEKISKLVQKISKYEKQKEKLQSLYTEYLEFTAIHKPDSITHSPQKLSKAVTDAVTAINTLVKELEKEDEERGLATLLPRKMEKVKWPTFSGEPGESFFKFKEQFFKAARQNMTTRADQIAKLRENLQGFPLTLVPETMESIQAAFTRLNDTYGDPQKLVNFELKKLEKVPMFPNCGDGTYTVGTRQQAEWLLQFETTIEELIKLGNNETGEDDPDPDLKRSVYGPQTTSLLLSKFPLSLKSQLINAAKANPGKEKLESYRDKLKDWSKQALDLEKYEPEAASTKSVQHVQTIRDPQVNVFNPPKALPSCIVCVELQKTEHISPDLPHLSAHVTGCPMFIEMTMMNRSNMCTSLNLCRLCLREDSTEHEKKCIVLKLKKKNRGDKSKYEFTCKDKFCFRHMWLCSKHKSANQESMDSKAADIENKHGFKLVHFLGHYKPPPTPAQPNPRQSVTKADKVPAKLDENDTKAFNVAEKKLRRKSA